MGKEPLIFAQTGIMSELFRKKEMFDILQMEETTENYTLNFTQYYLR